MKKLAAAATILMAGIVTAAPARAGHDVHVGGQFVHVSPGFSFSVGFGSPATQFIDATDTCGPGQGIVVDADGPGAGLGVCNSNLADGDNRSFAGNTVTVNGLTINAGTSATIKFQVVVN